MITQPPESTTVVLGTNVTFTCHGDGEVFWEINNTQVSGASLVPAFAEVMVFVPLPNDRFSELIVTGSRENNATLVIMCVVNPGVGVGDIEKSEPVQLLVYGKSDAWYISPCRLVDYKRVAVVV